MKATIAVLTYNGDEYLGALLDMCERQVSDFPFEILVVDSGSVDRTNEILAEHPTVRVQRIANSEFGHGKTRNLAAALARGEIIAYLTQDAVPCDEHWLASLVDSFNNADVALAFGSQRPRASCQPVVKHDLIRWFRRLDTPAARVVRGLPVGADAHDFDERTFFSNVNSAVRRAVLEQIPFRDVDYAEDRALAVDALAAGWTKVYVAEAAVWHSHDLGLRDYYRRMREEARGIRLVATSDVRDSPIRLVLATAAGTLRDWWFVLSDREYSMAEKFRWLLVVPVFNAARRLAIYASRRDARVATTAPRT